LDLQILPPFFKRYICEERHTITRDGFILTLQRVRKPGIPVHELKDPVLLVHGLFQCSGVFICDESQSLAFYLADRG